MAKQIRRRSSRREALRRKHGDALAEQIMSGYGRIGADASNYAQWKKRQGIKP